MLPLKPTYMQKRFLKVNLNTVRYYFKSYIDLITETTETVLPFLSIASCKFFIDL